MDGKPAVVVISTGAKALVRYAGPVERKNRSEAVKP